ncbi:MAG TPA: AMP-binding protein [Steroidobacteraceae bacterium]|nr:AMP-binding protein [Steroidobacteraceae bacterium]
MTSSQSLAANLLRAAQLTPEACAVQHGDVRTSYATLLSQAATVAHQLRVQGCEHGDRVALVLSNSSQFVAAYYGTVMVGAIAVLLNPAAKARDFTAWLADCDARFVMVDSGNNEAQSAASTHRASINVWKTSSEPSKPFGFDVRPEVVVTGVEANDPACILYTSGTTGQPKGVVLSHANLISNTAAIVGYLGLTSTDSIVTILPFYYSYGSSVLHTHIQAGGRIIIEQNLVYPHAVVETLAREKATGFAGVPSTYALLLARVKLGDYDLSQLRYITQAGGAMSPSLIQRLSEALPHTRLFVMYGQTEATARLTYLPPEKLEEKIGSVGIAIPGVNIEIRDEQGSTLSEGEVGEIWVRGANVMLGYWRNEGATTQAKRDGWLKTGDMGRLDHEGYLFLIGRRSDMIKAGAHRIHPQDIEDVIAELAPVQEVAVVGVNDELLGQVIKAYVVATEGVALSPLQVQAHCRARLANYKVPKSVEFVASLPRTSSGKIRRAELVQRTQQ